MWIFFITPVAIWAQSMFLAGWNAVWYKQRLIYPIACSSVFCRAPALMRMWHASKCKQKWTRCLTSPLHMVSLLRLCIWTALRRAQPRRCHFTMPIPLLWSGTYASWFLGLLTFLIDAMNKLQRNFARRLFTPTKLFRAISIAQTTHDKFKLFTGHFSSSHTGSGAENMGGGRLQ